MESQLFAHCTCPICYMPYDNKERIPRLITCSQGHTICSTCISIQISMLDPFQCPFDKQVIIVLENSITRFPINRALLGIIEEGHSNCLAHIDKKLDLVCRDCKQQICDRCERKGPHQGHDVNLKEDILEEAEHKLKSVKSMIHKVQGVIESSQMLINIREEVILADIDAKFNECLAILLRKREEVHDQIKSFCQKIRDSIELSELKKDDTVLANVADWRDAIEKKISALKDMMQEPFFYQVLDVNVETFSKEIEASIEKGQEDIQKKIRDIQQISFSFNSEFEANVAQLCDVTGISTEASSSRLRVSNEFKWKADWEKMNLLSEIKKVEDVYFAGFIDKTLETYEFRLEAVQQMSQVNSPNSLKAPPAYLSSFTCFLGSDPQCATLLKWYILDSTLQNSDKKIKLKELKMHSDLFNVVKMKIATLPSSLRFEDLILTAEQEQLLNQKIREYMEKSVLISNANSLLEFYLKELWIDACYAAQQLLRV